jgi:hypothetical protein
MAQSTRTVSLARATLSCRCHVCAFFHSREEEYQILLPFMKEGFPQVIVGGILQENPFYVPPAEFLRELSGRGATAH